MPSGIGPPEPPLSSLAAGDWLVIPPIFAFVAQAQPSKVGSNGDEGRCRRHRGGMAAWVG